MKIERLLAITVMLLNRRKVTATELSQHFGVSVRTIYRDFDTLNSAGIPVISQQGFEGGYGIPENYKLSRQLLTYDDMVSILTTLKGVNNTLNNSDIAAIIEKISTLIPAEKKEIYKQQLNSFIIDLSPWGEDHLSSLIEPVHRATEDSQILQISYTNSQGEKTERKVEPHALVLKNFSWYLLAFCKMKNGFRVFRLSRISTPVILNQQFIRKDIDPLSYFKPDADSRQPVQLHLRFSENVRFRIEESFLHDQIFQVSDSKIELKVNLPADD